MPCTERQVVNRSNIVFDTIQNYRRTEIQTYKNRSFARDAVLEELHFYDLKHNLVGIVVAQQKIS